MKQGKEKENMGQQLMGFHSLIDLSKRTGAVAHKVKEEGKVATDSMLAVFNDHLTYTFILESEVASIHYDKLRREIFFKGHNIKYMELDPKQVRVLMDLGEALKKDEKGRDFAAEYEATLGGLLADKKKGSSNKAHGT